MGDVIHTFPVVSALAKSGRGYTIDWVVNEEYVELVALSPHVRRVVPFKRKIMGGIMNPFKAMREMLSLAGELKSEKYDVVLDLQGLLRSGLVSATARAETRAGFADAREGAPFFYNRKVTVAGQITHAIDRNMELARSLGLIDTSTVEYDLKIPDAERERVAKLLPESPYFILNPNSRWSSKKWPVSRFAKVAKEFSGLTPVIIGSLDETETGASLARLTGDRAVDLTGKGGLTFLSALLQRAKFMLTNDSGPMHLASALGVKVVVIYGPTDPMKVGPYGDSGIVVKADTDCSPCRNRECEVSPSCMELVSVDKVAEACSEWT